jgi:hypothetical protein
MLLPKLKLLSFSAMDSSRHTDTPPNHEDEVCSSDDDLTMFGSSSSLTRMNHTLTQMIVVTTLKR